jgi:hypothetical protein
MKTLEEACKSTFVYSVKEPEESEIRAAIEKVHADIDRWRAIEDEVRACPWIHVYITKMLAMIATRQVTPGEALLACAAQMIAVGMEMERQPMTFAETPPAGYTGV